MHWCLHLCTWIYGSSLSNFGWLDFLSDVAFVSFTKGGLAGVVVVVV